jgi:hypothetical protein
MTFPSNDADLRTCLIGLQQDDFAFKIELGALVYWVWRFYWKSRKADTVVVRILGESQQTGHLELVNLFHGTPDEETVRTWLVKHAPE